jgi:hypothetical protein
MLGLPDNGVDWNTEYEKEYDFDRNKLGIRCYNYVCVQIISRSTFFSSHNALRYCLCRIS